MGDDRQQSSVVSHRSSVISRRPSLYLYYALIRTSEIPWTGSSKVNVTLLSFVVTCCGAVNSSNPSRALIAAY